MIPTPADLSSIHSWLDRWEASIRARDYEAGRVLFAHEVQSFCTFVNVAYGLDDLVDQQWRVVWPKTEGFTFSKEGSLIDLSEDRTRAVVAMLWFSFGIDRSGQKFRREGRATIVLTRSGVDEEWTAIHTHVSLSAGSTVPSAH